MNDDYVYVSSTMMMHDSEEVVFSTLISKVECVKSFRKLKELPRPNYPAMNEIQMHEISPQNLHILIKNRA